MPVDTTATLVLIVCVTIIAYHHVVYPLLLRHFAAEKRSASLSTSAFTQTTSSTPFAPSVTLLVPVYNEANVIEAHLTNILALQYPSELLTVVIALDGCTDSSAEIANRTIERAGARIVVRIVEYAKNIGKIALLNDQIAAIQSDIVALADASTLLGEDSLIRGVRHFRDPSIGVVCAAYALAEAGGEGERAYWNYQSRIKRDEAILAAPMGAHGAFYMLRRSCWQLLPPDTINDDFVMPMQIVLNGSRALYDESIVATDLDRTTSDKEFRRRMRIGAGNMQQTVRLTGLASPWRGWLAFLFLSGKGLRPLIPFLALIALVAGIQLASSARAPFYAGIFVSILVASLVTLSVAPLEECRLPRPVVWLRYLMFGHAASFLGSMHYLTGRHHQLWTESHGRIRIECYLPADVAVAKRVFDIILASLALPVLAVLLIPIALAIKLSSRGPVFYLQSRVGRVTSTQVTTFQLIKFRTMRDDAEAGVGPVLAADNDPRVNSVGRFLRGTHLDELPQIINVLRGDMSVVGPRPERPYFTQTFEMSIPFYSDRTFGLRPGITGLAQIQIKYDRCLSDVHQKVMLDHAYAARLGSIRDWLRTDVMVVARTALVVLTAQGH